MDTERKKLSAIEFAKEKLSLNPEATYAEIKAQAKFEGIPIFPVVYGRAKALLGLVPTAPYGSKSKVRKRAEAEAAEAAELARPIPSVPMQENPGEPVAKAAETSRAMRVRAAVARDARVDPAGSLEAMIEDLRTAVQERDRYRAMLEKLLGLIQDELER